MVIRKGILAPASLLVALSIALSLMVNPVADAASKKTLKLLWSDEFNGKKGSLPSSKTWTREIGGGGWGPIVSSTLIASGRHPKYTIGSVNLTEFFVSLASSLTFFAVIGLGYLHVIIGLILGGVIAAPIAARLANKLPVKSMMILVGIVIIIVSLRQIILGVPKFL